jgi:hypothetical protein
MAATWVGLSTSKTIISDNATPGDGTYAWGIIGKGLFSIPRGAIINSDTVFGTNLKEKDLDYTGTFLITNNAIKTAAEWGDYEDMLEYWDANDTRLFLSVKNEWNVELANRASSKSDAETLPITQNQWQGKLFNERRIPFANEVLINIEFHYTTQ